MRKWRERSSIQVFHSKFLDAKGLHAVKQRVSTQIRTNQCLNAVWKNCMILLAEKHVLHPCVRHGVGFHPTGATPCLLSGPSCKAGKMHCFARALRLSLPLQKRQGQCQPAFQLHVSIYSVWSWQPTACTCKKCSQGDKKASKRSQSLLANA